MHLLYLIPLLLLIPSCSRGGGGDAPPRAKESAQVPSQFRRFVYPGARVERLYTGEGVSGLTMRSPDPIERVAKFYLDSLGLPDDKVVTSRTVSYLYRGEDGDVLITVEKDDGGSVVSVAVAGKRRE